MEPLSDVMSLLRPRTAATRVMQAAGNWGLHGSRMAYPGFGLILKGECWFKVDDNAPLRLATGDFILVPAGVGFTIASDLACEIVSLDTPDPAPCQSGETIYGDPDLEPDFKQIGGYFQLDMANDDLLGRLLPTLVHIRCSDPAAGRLRRTIDLIVEEALDDRPGRDLIVNRLIEVLLVETLRFRIESVNAVAQPGLLSGLGDPLLARALRRLHGDVAHPWSVRELAREAGLSRSAFSKRFSQLVGMPPMQYLIDWRIALAKSILKQDAPPLEVVANAVGYQSASAFSTAFRRAVGSAPGSFARRAAG